MDGHGMKFLNRERKCKHLAEQREFEFAAEFAGMGRREPKVQQIGQKIATHQKARLIAEYLRLFVFVTRSGYYLDLFAGPQEEKEESESWSARRVIEQQPPDRCLNGYFLFEKAPSQYKRLESLCSSLSEELRKRVSTYFGNSNKEVNKVLLPEILKPSRPVFALLDQRTFECEWETVRRLADFKRQTEYKCELFYFFASKWMPRAIHALKEEGKGVRWWGRADYQSLLNKKPYEREEVIRNRFREELGYSYVTSWPFFEKDQGRGQLVYFMVHASDHYEAPGLMRRAYSKAVISEEAASAFQTSFLEEASIPECLSEDEAFERGMRAWRNQCAPEVNPFSSKSPYGKAWIQALAGSQTSGEARCAVQRTCA